MKTLSFFYGRCPFPGRLRNNIFQSPRHVFTYLSPSVVFVGITLNLIQSLKQHYIKTLKNKLIACTFAILEDKFKIQI